LRSRGERPTDRGANEGDELAAVQSIIPRSGQPKSIFPQPSGYDEDSSKIAAAYANGAIRMPEGLVMTHSSDWQCLSCGLSHQRIDQHRWCRLIDPMMEHQPRRRGTSQPRHLELVEG
jgi:hypothetical protein